MSVDVIRDDIASDRNHLGKEAMRCDGGQSPRLIFSHPYNSFSTRICLAPVWFSPSINQSINKSDAASLLLAELIRQINPRAARASKAVLWLPIEVYVAPVSPDPSESKGQGLKVTYRPGSR